MQLSTVQPRLLTLLLLLLWMEAAQYVLRSRFVLFYTNKKGEMKVIKNELSSREITLHRWSHLLEKFI